MSETPPQEKVIVAAVRRVVVLVVGAVLGVIGVVLIFTPGPAFVVLGLALGVLAAEFRWARRWLRKLRVMARDALARGRERSRAGCSADDQDGTGRVPEDPAGGGSEQ